METILEQRVCIDCGKTLNLYNKSGLCRSCGKTGERNPSFKHGQCKNGSKCIDCGKSVYYKSLRCKVCANSGDLNPLAGLFGNINPNYEGIEKPKCCICGKSLSNYFARLCSECYQDNMYGSNNPNWRNGITLIGRRIRNLKVYKYWHEACLERDNYTCQRCGSMENLEVHLKISVRQIIKDNNIKNSKMALDVPELWMLELGITYCFTCHCIIDQARWFLNKRSKVWSK